MSVITAISASWKTETIAMASSRLLFFLCFIVSRLLAFTTAQEQEQEQELLNICLANQGNFTTNSTYQANLNQLLSSLASNTEVDYGFYNASYGQNPDTVNAQALCRGDVQPESCQDCVNKATLALPKNCPNQKEAMIWYDHCMLRYSNRSLFGTMEFEPPFILININNVSEVNQFNQVLGTLLDRLKKQAASGDSLLKFATGNATTPGSQTIYALMQCTPDLSEKECSDCLNNATGLIPSCCDGKEGARILTPSCNLRYEKYIFYYPGAYAPTPSPSPPPSTATLPSARQPPSSQEQNSPSPQASTATQKGEEKNPSRTFVLIAVPLLLLQYL